MSLLIGSMTIGFILSLLALGVFLSFRIFAFPDITAEGSITLGASVAAADACWERVLDIDRRTGLAPDPSVQLARSAQPAPGSRARRR